MRHRSETSLAHLTLVLVILHFILETGAHFKWGQPLQALIVDYIFIILGLFAGTLSLKARPKSAAGLLAAAWGFGVGFGWRSAFGRLALTDAERAASNGEPMVITYVIVIALALAFCIFGWSLWLAYRQARS